MRDIAVRRGRWRPSTEVSGRRRRRPPIVDCAGVVNCAEQTGDGSRSSHRLPALQSVRAPACDAGLFARIHATKTAMGSKFSATARLSSQSRINDARAFLSRVFKSLMATLSVARPPHRFRAAIWPFATLIRKRSNSHPHAEIYPATLNDYPPGTPFELASARRLQHHQ